MTWNPVRWLLWAVRRWRLRHDLYTQHAERHPALAKLTIGEVFPWKGIQWRVAAVNDNPLPAVVLVPLQDTRNSKLNAVRTLRRRDKIFSKQEQAARDTLARGAWRRERPDVDQSA
jgi:hypothetical protein